ncbi:peptidase associated/transthyretin-like domain-containing protein [Niabella drilacis]|uniref:CarboxypepD_reg-like domain-containing protein n=1 Tax=Niabella drilacis (strain DSM 25811 / CCM 8410 / CCUG 62505 / LMG 26954 / E90) TaxID=1285928 RepID=A0A1G6N0I3_NIADE|nr:carboxypeptidase-like regulatory domain-containing protein [Niabella drilacis]SDC60947.1 hypothetical protein SAMN04487894_10395 [Niabella drilacis]
MIRNFFFSGFLFFCITAVAQARQVQGAISGTVFSEYGEKLVYVNVGIRNKNTDGLSGKDGYFRLVLDPACFKDTLCISYAGYEDQLLPIDSLLRDRMPLKIILRQKTLPEVKISYAPERTIKKLGVTVRSPFVYGTVKGGHVEMAQYINLKRPGKLLNLTFFLYGSKKARDTLTIRINVYAVHNGAPGSRIIDKTVIRRVPISTGRITLPLKEEHLYYTMPVFIGVELIPDDQRSSEDHLYAYGARTGGKAFTRTAGLGPWEITRGVTPTLYVEVQQ